MYFLIPSPLTHSSTPTLPSLSLTFGFLITTGLEVGLLGPSSLGVCFLDLHVYFLHQIREVLFHDFFKSISSFLLFLFSFWHPYDANVGPLEVVPEAAYTILFVLDSFFLRVVLIGCFLLPYVPNH